MMNKTAEQNWDIELTAQRSLWDLRLTDVWAYRDLLWLLVRRDFVSFYKQTVLGPIWFFVQPAITVVIYTIIFGNLAGISTNGVPKPLFYLAGTVLWNYFAECLTKTSTVFKDNAAMLGKVYFPRLIMPLSIILSNLIRFGVQLLLFAGVYACYLIKGEVVAPNIYLLLLPVLIALVAAQGLGLGMLISAVTNKYRDLAFVVTFGVPLLMYTTTVVYPLSEVIIKYPDYAWLVKLNPLTTIIEAFRYSILGKGMIDVQLFIYCATSTLLILMAGVIVFNKVEKNFIDTV